MDHAIRTVRSTIHGFAMLERLPGLPVGRRSGPELRLDDPLHRPRPAGHECPVAPSLALGPPQAVRGRPPLHDEHRGLGVEVGMHDLGDVGLEAVAVRSFGDRPGRQSPGRRSSPRPATAPRRPRPGRPWRCAGRTADPGGDPPPCGRSPSSRTPARHPRKPPRSRRSAATRRLARWQSSYAGARRTAPVPAVRTPAPPVRRPAMPSSAHDRTRRPANADAFVTHQGRRVLRRHRQISGRSTRSHGWRSRKARTRRENSAR